MHSDDPKMISGQLSLKSLHSSVDITGSARYMPHKCSVDLMSRLPMQCRGDKFDLAPLAELPPPQGDIIGWRPSRAELQAFRLEPGTFEMDKVTTLSALPSSAKLLSSNSRQACRELPVTHDVLIPARVSGLAMPEFAMDGTVIHLMNAAPQA